jgi:hypothetical protein
MEEVSLSEHEADLRAAFVHVPEYEAADWATQSLAVVIARAGRSGWANRSAGDYRRRAIILLTVRMLRAIRAGMAVHAVGWEVEGRALDRLVAETRARLHEVEADPTDAIGKRWLERKPQTTITAALQASMPEMDSQMLKGLYGALSQDSHADVGGVMRSLTTVDEDLAAEVTWGPRHTIASRQSLVLFASFASEAATALAVEAQVLHPDRDVLAERIEAAHATLAQAEHASD